MSSSYETIINNVSYFQSIKKLYDPIKVENSYEISASFPQNTSYDLQESESVVYGEIIAPSGSSLYEYLKDDPFLRISAIKQDYLNTYSSTIQHFIMAGRKSVYLRSNATTGSTITGAQLFKGSPFHDLVDIQQLKEYASNIFASDPCLLMDSENINAVIEPIKVAMLKVNFKLLCRTIITTLKLQNVFLSSVFDNQEFYKSNNYYDSTFVDYGFQILLQKMQLSIPKYRKSIETLLYEELQKKISDGEEILDPITNKEVVFETPLTDDNYFSNIEKYMNVLFKEEMLFITDKTNTLFNVTGSDPATFASYSLAPSSSFGGSKLLTAKEYFVDSLPITGLDNTFDDYGSGTSTSELTDLLANETKLFLEVVVNKDLENAKINTFLRLNNLAIIDSRYFISKICEVKIENTLNEDIVGEKLLTFILRRIPQLKQKMLEDETFLLLTNYVFPVNKILNIASLFYINMSLKLYQNLNDITKGSVKAVSTIHNMVLDNNQDCDTPSPVDFNVDDMILGVNLEILKAIALTPIEILKAIEETFDPNIFIASKIRTLAENVGAPKLPIIPYSAPLMLPPPYGPGILPIAPWGYYYWAVDAGELALLYAKDGFQTNSLPQFNVSKDPFKPDC